VFEDVNLNDKRKDLSNVLQENEYSEERRKRGGKSNFSPFGSHSRGSNTRTEVNEGTRTTRGGGIYRCGFNLLPFETDAFHGRQMEDDLDPTPVSIHEQGVGTQDWLSTAIYSKKITMNSIIHVPPTGIEEEGVANGYEKDENPTKQVVTTSDPHELDAVVLTNMNTILTDFFVLLDVTTTNTSSSKYEHAQSTTLQKTS